MKVRDTSVKHFLPVSIEITFETQDELDAFGSLCNTSFVVDAMSKVKGKLPSYETMEDFGADINKHAWDIADFLLKRR